MLAKNERFRSLLDTFVKRRLNWHLFRYELDCIGRLLIHQHGEKSNRKYLLACKKKSTSVSVNSAVYHFMYQVSPPLLGTVKLDKAMRPPDYSRCFPQQNGNGKPSMLGDHNGESWYGQELKWGKAT